MCHQKRAQHFYMHTQDGSIHPRGVKTECARRIQYPLASGRHGEVIEEEIKLYRIVMVPQEHRRPRLILDLLEQPGEGTPSVNDTTDRETAP